MWIKYQTVDRGAATLGRQVAPQCGSVPTKLACGAQRWGLGQPSLALQYIHVYILDLIYFIYHFS